MDLLGAGAVLQLGEGDGAAVAPADDFAVKDKIAGDCADRFEKLGEFGHAVEGAGEDFDLRIALVNLRADAIELVFDEGAVGARGDELVWLLWTAGQHYRDGADEIGVDGVLFV